MITSIYLFFLHWITSASCFTTLSSLLLYFSSQSQNQKKKNQGSVVGKWRLRGENQPEWSERLKVMWKRRKGGQIAQSERWRGHRGKGAGRCCWRRKKKPGKRWGRKDKAGANRGTQSRGTQMKKSGERKKESETEGEVEGWEVDRQITTKLRLADSCESRIWYCGMDTQTQACTRAHMQAGARVRVCVCARTQAGGGTYTCSHYPKEPHYTWNINGAKQSAKMEMGETERGESKKERQMKAICLYYQSDMRTFSKLICILNHHFLPGAWSAHRNNSFSSSVVFYLYPQATKQGHPER